MIKTITACLCSAVIVFGSVTYDPFSAWLIKYEKKFEWVAESTIELITRFEGKRYKAYIDGAGKWTIGIGHMILHGESHMLHRELSEDEVRGILHSDLKKCSIALESSVKVPVTRTQADAMHSLCHNIGPDRMAKSDVIKHLNDGDVYKAADAFLNWSNPAQLKQRRKAERALFLAEI
jgi:lysozyme